jgi:hypothetical protein
MNFIPPHSDQLLELAKTGSYPAPLYCEIHVGAEDWKCNVYAMEKLKETGSKPQRCWCMDAVFTPSVKGQVPDEAKGKACICAKCAC